MWINITANESLFPAKPSVGKLLSGLSLRSEIFSYVILFYLIVVHICIESFFAKSVETLKVAFMSNIHS